MVEVPRLGYQIAEFLFRLLFTEEQQIGFSFERQLLKQGVVDPVPFQVSFKDLDHCGVYFGLL